MRKGVLIGFMYWLAFGGYCQLKNIAIPEEMSKLAFLIGEWDCHVKTFDKKDKVIMERSYFMNYRKEFNGMLIITDGGTIRDGETFLGQTKWLFFDKVNDQYKQVNFDMVGNFHTYVGQFVKKDLVIQFPNPEVGSDGVVRTWRKTYTGISEDRFTVIYDYSEDNGKTWTVQWHQFYKRL